MDWIKDSDLLMESHFPVADVFFDAGSYAASYGFLKFLKCLSEHVGWAGNFGGCSFWEDLDEYDREQIDYFDGVLFSTGNGDEIVISYSELYYYMKLACERYLQVRPNDAEKVNGILEAFRERHSIQA